MGTDPTPSSTPLSIAGMEVRPEPAAPEGALFVFAPDGSVVVARPGREAVRVSAMVIARIRSAAMHEAMRRFRDGID